MLEALLNSWPRWVPALYDRLQLLRGRWSASRELGYPSDARLLIINLDDAGLCHSHNMAVAEALERGAATSCTVMTVTPGFEEFAQMARQNPHWSVGVHLVLTSEWPGLRWGPLVGGQRAPSLVDREGCFHPTLLGSIVRGRPAEVRREWRAQVLRAVDAGIRIDHLDCHMGPYHFRPAFFRIARDLAREFQLAMRVVAPWRQAASWRLGVPCGDRAIVIPHRQQGRRLWHTVEDRREQLLTWLGDLRPGISFWWTHISLDDDQWRSIRPPDEDLDKEDYPGEHRDQYEERIADYMVLSDPSFKASLEARGIHLVSYQPLKELAARSVRSARPRSAGF